MQESIFKEINIHLVSPSPFQHRRSFTKLKELGDSIARDGLVQPITVRTVGNGFELIAGDRRFRAAKEYAGLDKIMARIVYVDDHTARRMCATENMQREDLSAVEVVEGIIDIIGADFADDAEFVALGGTDKERVKVLLGRLHTVERHDSISKEAEKFANKFVSEVEKVFLNLPKPVDWHSFYQHDLNIASIPDDIKQWAAANKLNKSQTKALDKLAKVDKKAFDEIVSKADEEGVIAVSNGFETVPLQELSAAEIRFKASPEAQSVIATLHTGDEESYTPPEYLESARIVMGGIDLDPASNLMAQENVKASTYYTVHDDGLSKDWKGNVWMNPPYTALVINQFIEKLVRHHEGGDVTQAIVLTNNNTDTSWFHIGAKAASAVCFTSGRINFLKRDGTKSSPTNGQSFFYFGNQVEAFRDEFSKHGLVMVKA